MTTTRTHGLIDIGDPSAPKGSPSWCRACLSSLVMRKKQGQTAISNLKYDLLSFREQEHFQSLTDQDGEPFQTWEDFVQYPEPFGLGMRADVAAAIMAESEGTRAMTNAADLDVHPIANLLPAMSTDDYTALRDSIRDNGQREPITLHRDGRIIDGRHRARACTELNLPVLSKGFDREDTELVAYVLDLNLKRRHLDPMQRAMIAAELATMPQGRPDKSATLRVCQADAARLVGVSTRLVQTAAVVHAHATAPIIAAAREGRLPAVHAERVARLPAARQAQVAADLGDGKHASTIVLAASRSDRVDKIEAASVAQPLSALGRRFPVILADPPWAFETRSEGGLQKAADLHYPTMTIEQIRALPVAEIAASNSVLFLWALPSMFPEALSVLDSWGFTFKTFAIWAKPTIGTGHWFRGQFEPLILATRGAMPPPSPLHSSIFEGRTSGAHSEKPASVRDWIAAAYPDAGRIELFAREAAPGWTAWGHEASNRKELPI